MVFNKLINKFKGKEKEEDFSNLSLRNLKKGSIFEYFVQTWEVVECYEYDWGNEFFSKEYLINNGKEKLYLHVEDDGELKISVTKEEKVMLIDKEIKSDIIKDDKPQKKIVYKGKTYYLSNENQGYFRKIENNDWSEFVSWEFTDEEEKDFISLMRWGETDISAAVGQYVEEYEFSNFLPSSK